MEIVVALDVGRAGERDRDPGRTRRRPPLLILRRRCPPLRPRCHRLPIGQQARSGPSLARRTGAVALGAVRSGGVGRPGRLARSRLLPPGRRAARPHPRLPLGRAQALPARLPHPARTRRRSPRPRPPRPARRGGDRRCRLTTPVFARACPSSRRCLRPAPPNPPPPAPHQPGRPRETERPQATPRGNHTPSIILSPDPPRPRT